MTVNLGQSPFVHAPPPEAGVKAVIKARLGGVGGVVEQPQPTVATGAGAAGDGEEEEGRRALDLEEFSCATDLAASFGPNRLKVSFVDANGNLVSSLFYFSFVFLCLFFSLEILSVGSPPFFSPTFVSALEAALSITTLFTEKLPPKRSALRGNVRFPQKTFRKVARTLHGDYRSAPKRPAIVCLCKYLCACPFLGVGFLSCCKI